MLRYIVRELEGGRLVQLTIEYHDGVAWNPRLTEFPLPKAAWAIMLQNMKPSRNYEVVFEE